MDKPEALWLAEALDRQYLHAYKHAAAELRRLHAENAALAAALRARVAERERCLRLIDEHVRAVDAEDVVRAIREAKE